MADFTSSHVPSFTGPFQAVFNALVRMAESSSKMRAVDVLNATTDAELEARGTTRLDEVNRIFGGLFL